MKPTLLAALLAITLGSQNAAGEQKQGFELGGLLQLDADFTGKFYNLNAQSNSEFDVRRARLNANYRFNRDWRAKFTAQYEESGDSFNINNAWIRYRGFDAVKITIGKFKQPFGLERLDSVRSITPLARAMTTSELTPNRAFGIQLHKFRKRRTWAVGIFQIHDDDHRFPNTAPQSITGRYSFAPVRSKSNVLHLGIAGSYTDWNENPFRLRESAEVGSADNIIRSARFNADKQWQIGLESAWQQGPLRLQAEYMLTEIDASDLAQQFNYDGFYVQASYALSGEHRRYNDGEFSSLKPHSERGAVEVFARYSEIDLRDSVGNDAIGAEASVMTVGANVYVDKTIRMGVNYLMPEISGDTVHQQSTGDAISLRFQLSF
ncbi:MAG: OprO/OprP family phosphate-selective porin [Pseudomonadales bacterium]